jgi:hypothetical protein
MPRKWPDGRSLGYKTRTKGVGMKTGNSWTWEAQEIFQVNGAGKISQIEAVLQSVPYGMRPGWTTGVHLPSESVRRDGFKEY